MIGELDTATKMLCRLKIRLSTTWMELPSLRLGQRLVKHFAKGLRAALRQDPDIIMVGEIRDKETAQLAIQAALTGHLVLSTIHTNNSIGVIPRLIDMGLILT